MKKLSIILCFTTVLAMPSLAQHRIGGDFGLGVGSTKETGSKSSVTSLIFVLEPQYFYAPNEKWEIGGSMTLGTMQWIGKSENYKRRASGFYWAINPSARCRLVGYERFGLWMETNATLGVEQDGYYRNSNGNKEHDKSAMVDLHWGININPVLTYQISEHFRMDATLGFLGVGLNGMTGIIDGEAQYTAVDFGVHIANGTATNIIDHAGTVITALDDAVNSEAQLIGARCIAKLLDLKIGFVYTF